MGVPAEILVYEGMSHGDYGAEAASSESQHAYDELGAFLSHHLD